MTAHVNHRINAKLEAVHVAAGTSCRKCTHCKEREVIAPQCMKYPRELHKRFDPVTEKIKTTWVARFCYDARVTEALCGWRARGFEPVVIRPSIFTGAKFDGEE